MANPLVSIIVLGNHTSHANRTTGFHASTAEEFAEGYEKALSVPNPLAMRLRARKSAKRFTEEEFARLWLIEMERLVKLTK